MNITSIFKLYKLTIIWKYLYLFTLSIKYIDGAFKFISCFQRQTNDAITLLYNFPCNLPLNYYSLNYCNGNIITYR